MTGKIVLGSLFVFFILSFTALQTIEARDTDSRSPKVVTTSRSSQPSDNPQAIIDPLFKQGRSNPQGDNAIIDPLFKPNGQRTASNDNTIIDPLFKPSGQRTTSDDNTIIDPLFVKGKSRKATSI
jgi:hypothetical protein